MIRYEINDYSLCEEKPTAAELVWDTAIYPSYDRLIRHGMGGYKKRIYERVTICCNPYELKFTPKTHYGDFIVPEISIPNSPEVFNLIKILSAGAEELRKEANDAERIKMIENLYRVRKFISGDEYDNYEGTLKRK